MRRIWNRACGMVGKMKKGNKRKRVFTFIISMIAVLSLAACSASAGSGMSGEEKSAAYESTGSYDAPYAEYEEELAVEPAEAAEWDSSADSALADTGTGFASPDQIPNPSAKMIYTASLDMQTLNYDESLEKILAAIRSAGGFIESQTEGNNNYGWYYEEDNSDDRYANITARIPSSGFDSFVDSLEEMGQVTGKSVNAENITQQYYETEASVEALEIERDRLLEMMDKAETIEDMIAVENRLTEVERTLSSYKTDLSYMDKSVEFSTVYIYLDEVQEYTEEPPESFSQRLVFSIKDSLKGFGRGMQNLLIGLIYLLPFLLVIAAVAVVIVLIVRKVSKSHPERAAKRAQKKAEKAKRKAEKAEKKAGNRETEKKEE